MIVRAAALVACLLALPASGQEELDPRFEPKFTYSTRRGILRDKGLVTLFYRVSNRQRGAQLSQYLTKWKSKRGNIHHSADLNLLAVTDTEENIKLLQRILEIVDTPEPQVMIEAKVVEVTYDSELQIGGEAEIFNTNAKDTFLRRVDETFNPDAFLNAVATGQQFQGATFDFRNLGNETRTFGQIRATLRTLIERGNAEILSSPRLMVQSGQQAEINTGQEVPVQEAQLRGNTSIITTRFKKVGITLNVKPFLIGNASVDMDVTAEVSAVSGFTAPAGTGGISNPIISTRKVKTRVNVRDNETLIIGGLLRNESVIEERGIPFLADLPVVGFVFKSYRRALAKQELIFFLTPVIQRENRVLIPPRERR